MIPAAPRHPLVMLALGLILLPWAVLAGGYTWGIATEIAILAMVGIGYNLLLGYTGLLSFGHGLFFGLAAYCVALTQLHWFPNSMLLPLAGGVLFAALLGVVIGFLALRRRGVYFSLLTLAFTALTYYIVFRWTSVTGGENGLSGVRRLAPLGLDFDDQRLFYYFCAVIVFLTAWLVWRVVHAPLGTVLMAIRENEQRARFAGYPVLRYKLAAFVVSTVVVGLGGSLFAFLKLFVSADLVHVSFSGELLAMTVVGGMGSFLGPALGAAFYLMFREIVTSYTTSWQFWFGLLFMATILFSPLGLAGPRRARPRANAQEAVRCRRHGCARDAATAPGGPRLPAQSSQARRGAARLQGRHQALRRIHRRRRRGHRHRRPQAARPDRSQRGRQDHAVQPDLGDVLARPGHGRAGRPVHRRPGAGRGHGAWPGALVPDHQPVSLAQRVGAPAPGRAGTLAQPVQSPAPRLRARAGEPRDARAGEVPRARRAWSKSPCRACPTAGSAWSRSAWRWQPSRAAFCSTSRWSAWRRPSASASPS